jgi:hypothetical protein
MFLSENYLAFTSDQSNSCDDRAERGIKGEKIMTTFTIDEQNQIVAFATAEQAAAATSTPFDTFATQEELTELATRWRAPRLLAIWNSLPGVSPVKRFKNPKAVIGCIWERIQSLAELATPEASQQANAGKRSPRVASPKAAAKRKTASAKKAKRAKTRAATSAAAPRPGSKTAQVITMLRRKNGATLDEIMEKMSWQKHTVRGFMAGAMKKAGYSVESFKPDGGARTYRLPSQ